MSRYFVGPVIRRHCIDRLGCGAPLREKARAIRANTCEPDTTFRERNDVHTPWAGAGHYAIYMKQAIAPMYGCRDDCAIFAELEQRLGINDYDGKTEEQCLRTSLRTLSTTSRQEAGVARPRTRWPSPLRSAIPIPTSSRRPQA